MAAKSKHLAATGLLLFGAASSVLNKLVYGLRGEGLDGRIKAFEKPWFATALMFLFMALILPLSLCASYLARWRQQPEREDDSQQEPLLAGDSAADSPDAPRPARSAVKDVLLVALPTVFDLVATLLMSIGLLNVTASIYQMLRGAEMLFAALFAVTWLKRSLNRKHWAGLALCFAGILVIGSSSLVTGSGDVSQDAGAATVGMLLIVLAQAVQAAQVTLEDHVLRDLGLAPLTVVGWEGVWGTLMMGAVLLPLAQHLPGREGAGIHEDTVETFHMLRHSVPAWTIPSILAATGVALLGYNVSGMWVTNDIGATARCVLESCRTALVWAVGLALHYSHAVPRSLGDVGEKWDRSSYLQALGFAILLAGTVVFGRGDEEQEKAQEAIEGAPQLAKAPQKQRPFTHPSTIAAYSRHSPGVGRWRAAAHAAIAQARLAHEADHSQHHV